MAAQSMVRDLVHELRHVIAKTKAAYDIRWLGEAAEAARFDFKWACDACVVFLARAWFLWNFERPITHVTQ